MLSKLKYLIFSLVWLGIFFELLFEPAIRDVLFQLLKLHPIMAPFALILVQILFATFALPCSPLTVLAGMLWGFWVGVLYSIIATILASTWTFLIGRYFLRDKLLRGQQTKWFSKIFRLIESYNWKASMVAHANPIFPGSSLGYAFGLSDVSIKHFALGAIIGTLPLQLMIVGIGYFAHKVLVYDFNHWVLLSIMVLLVICILYKKLVPLILDANEEDVVLNDHNR